MVARRACWLTATTSGDHWTGRQQHSLSAIEQQQQLSAISLNKTTFDSVVGAHCSELVVVVALVVVALVVMDCWAWPELAGM